LMRSAAARSPSIMPTSRPCSAGFAAADWHIDSHVTPWLAALLEVITG
jgi:hypothetical protein